ncbi:MAG: serine-type D-Ala-D-Ala carboxypeptidase [Parcubacteria group bacterium Gr01-1014_3]|nr:MAG: serine-type D-Ala-D-Ala carboxypeptidase [Parcubacteria group bacterium Gr01-1014_3]
MKLNLTKILLIIGGAGLLGYGGYSYWQTSEENTARGAKITDLEQSLVKAGEENNNLLQALNTERSKTGAFEVKISELSSIVGNLQKWSATDPELLRKYSKVYFLSENYAPAQLSSLDPQYLYEKNRTQLIHSGVSGRLGSLLEAAKAEGMNLLILSAYRSFYEQASVKSGYSVTYGAGTSNQFSADQGYSEHQLGTAVDFSTLENGPTFSKFEQATAYKWLTDNAYKFGFALSYPKNNLYYKFEPWHWRFVGVALAKYLHDQSKSFYDLTQRELDDYLITIFN